MSRQVGKNMKQIIISIVLFLTFFLPCTAQEELPNAILYEITGNGLKHPSYLFGSIHVISGPSVFKFPHFYEVWNKVSRLVLETDLSAKADSISAIRMAKNKPSALPQGLNSMYLASDSSYQEVLGEEKAHKIDSVMKAFTPQFQMNIHPCYASMILKLIVSQNLSERYNGRLIPIDGYLNDVAERAKKQIDSLESREFQEEMSINTTLYNAHVQDSLASLPLTTQMEQFYEECMKAGEDIAHMQAIKRLYKEGKGYDTVNEILKTRDEKVNALMRVEQRNFSWMRKIPRFMAEQPTLIVVGLAHLYPFFESRGLLHDLIEAGYTVTPLK